MDNRKNGKLSESLSLNQVSKRATQAVVATKDDYCSRCQALDLEKFFDDRPYNSQPSMPGVKYPRILMRIGY